MKYQKKKKNSQCICLSVILLNYVFAIGENYYPQVFSEKCKYVIKEKHFKYIFDDILMAIFSDSGYEEILIMNFDEVILKKTQTEKDSDKEN